MSFAAPHKAISRDTLACWTLWMLKEAGINVSKYGSHSTRGAMASAANRFGVLINLILKQAGWRNVESFVNCYNKALDQEPADVGGALLRNALHPC